MRSQHRCCSRISCNHWIQDIPNIRRGGPTDRAGQPDPRCQGATRYFASDRRSRHSDSVRASRRRTTDLRCSPHDTARCFRGSGTSHRATAPFGRRPNMARAARNRLRSSCVDELRSCRQRSVEVVCSGRRRRAAAGVASVRRTQTVAEAKPPRSSRQPAAQ